MTADGRYFEISAKETKELGCQYLPKRTRGGVTAGVSETSASDVRDTNL